MCTCSNKKKQRQVKIILKMVLRPDLIINGVGSLIVGTVLTVAVFSMWDGSSAYGPYALVAWALLGAPCCLLAGLSAGFELLGAQDPLALLSQNVRCDVPATTGNGFRNLDV